ncbi:MAG: hypothetical protein SGILL_007011, partial [Bacillariaceae sp.]
MAVGRASQNDDGTGGYNDNKDEDRVDDHRNANQVQDDGSEDTYFFVVDMDLNTQGDMVDEVSQISDPTGYMLTAPGHIISARGRSKKKHIHGKRRLSATSLLKKNPIAKIIQNSPYFHLGGGGNQKHQQQPSRKYSKVSKPEEDVKMSASPAATSKERVPLTLMVPLGAEDSGGQSGNVYYGTLNGGGEENRNPQTHHLYKSESSKSREPPSSSSLQHLYPTESWDDDDRLLLFEDHATPKTPLGL